MYLFKSVLIKSCFYQVQSDSGSQGKTNTWQLIYAGHRMRTQFGDDVMLKFQVQLKDSIEIQTDVGRPLKTGMRDSVHHRGPLSI